MPDVTRILNVIEQGDTQAAAELLPVVYEELRSLASCKLARETPGQTLQATALVHEAYLRLLGENANWTNRGHFFAAAAEAMRRILIENARRKKSLKHGGNRQRIEIEDVILAQKTIAADDLLALDEALSKLAEIDQRKAELVKLRYFAGLTGKEVAQILDISTSTADEHWAYARAWLRLEIEKGHAPSSEA
jgi:RNA polymerase sigma factor (TIGR02999 family)